MALETFRRALAAREPDPEKAAPIALARYAVGKALRALGRSEEAIPLLEQAVAWADGADAPDGWYHEELAEEYAAAGRTTKRASTPAAIPLLERADPSFATTRRVTEDAMRSARLHALAGLADPPESRQSASRYASSSRRSTNEESTANVSSTGSGDARSTPGRAQNVERVLGAAGAQEAEVALRGARLAVEHSAGERVRAGDASRVLEDVERPVQVQELAQVMPTRSRSSSTSGAVRLAEESGQSARSSTSAREPLPTLDALVRLALEPRERRHDEEVAVEVRHRLVEHARAGASRSVIDSSRCARRSAWWKFEATSATNSRIVAP